MKTRYLTRRRSFAFFVTFVAAGRALAQPAAATTQPFDALVAEYRPHLDVDDPLGFGIKVRALLADEYTFWRGTKGRFYAWCGANAAEFLRDPADRVPAHGDLHYGNVGTYAVGPNLGDLAFGMVDFDDSQTLPFQVELLHLFVNARLVAPRIGAAVADLDAATLDAYRVALTSGQTATQRLRDDPTVAALFAKAADIPYDDDLAKFCEVDGSFRPLVGKRAKPSDLLETIREPARLDAFAAAIAQASAGDAGLRAVIGTDDRATIRGRLVGVARRTRLKSSGSQGLNKYLVRLWRPTGHDVIVSLKQQIPTAAERAEYVPLDARPPGERAAALAESLATPRPIVNGSASLEGGSYLVSLREPWSDELDADDVTSPGELLQFCRIAATVAGAAHGADGRGTAIVAKLDGALASALAARADAYVAEMRAAFAAMREDSRARDLAARADAAIEASSHR